MPYFGNMKSIKLNWWLILITFGPLAGSLHSQAYLPLLDAPSEWHLTWCDASCKTEIYYTDGDTLDSGHQYKVLNGFHYISRQFWLREDPGSQQVWLSLPIDRKRQEFLLYDFSLQVGDSINMYNPISPFPQNGGIYLLDSIVSRILLDGLSHRFYYFSAGSNVSNPQQPVWIEGIGSLSLINAPGGTPTWLNHGKLSCYFKGSGKIYEDLDTINDCVAQYLGTKGMGGSNTLKISYNREKQCYRLLGLEAGHYQITMYDLLGRPAFSRLIQVLGAEVAEISTKTLRPGSYLLQVEDLNRGHQHHLLFRHWAP